jgi:hypothetical protein
VLGCAECEWSYVCQFVLVGEVGGGQVVRWSMFDDYLINIICLFCFVIYIVYKLVLILTLIFVDLLTNLI